MSNLLPAPSTVATSCPAMRTRASGSDSGLKTRSRTTDITHMPFGFRSRAEREAEEREKYRQYGVKLREEAAEKAKELPERWVKGLGPESGLFAASPKFSRESAVPLLPHAEVVALHNLLAMGAEAPRTALWAHRVATTFTGVQSCYETDGNFPSLPADEDEASTRARAIGLLSFFFTRYSAWSMFMTYQDSEPGFRALSEAWGLRDHELEDGLLTVAGCRAVASGLSGPLKRTPDERSEFVGKNRAWWERQSGYGFVEAFWDYCDRGVPGGDRIIDIAVEACATHGQEVDVMRPSPSRPGGFVLCSASSAA